jgi:hypothetical protein
VNGQLIEDVEQIAREFGGHDANLLIMVKRKRRVLYGKCAGQVRLKESRIIGLDEVTPVEAPIECGNDGVGTVPAAGKSPRKRPWKAPHDLFRLDSDLAGLFHHDGL